MIVKRLPAADGAIETWLFQQSGDDPFARDAARDIQASEVAAFIAGFLQGAQTSLDIAIYDFRLHGEAAKIVSSALATRLDAGVAVRILFDEGAPVERGDDGSGNDLAPGGTAQFLSGLNLPIEVKGVTGRQQRRYSKHALMHNKYIVRDEQSPEAAILTGSCNFTNDAFGLQENNMISLRSNTLARLYTADFNDIWQAGEILPSSGENDSGEITVNGVSAGVDFAPGRGQSIVAKVVHAIDTAVDRISIASMLITSGPILAALSEAVDRGVAFEGVVDGTQMETSLRQLRGSGKGEDRVAAWEKLRPYLASKKSVKFAPGSPHDFMHMKTLVADGTVVTGSFNFSNSARGNAENVLVIRDSALANGYRSFIQDLARRYKRGS